MIQFNLLPDVKLQHIKATRTKRTVMTVAVLTGGATVGLMILMFLHVNVVQRNHMNNLDADIEASSRTLEETPELDKVLTVQNQLHNLTALHDEKPLTSRLFTYATQFTPADAKISEMRLNLAENSLAIDGTANSLETINKFVDTLKFTTYKSEGEAAANAFTSVVLSDFSKGEENATYSILFSFDPNIFDNNKAVKLTVPNVITTRSTTERPEALFEEAESEEE